MPLSGNFNRRPFEEQYQQIEIDALCLAVTCAELVEKISKKHKFSFGEPMMRAMIEAGADIRGACTKHAKAPERVRLLSAARPLLRKVNFVAEASLCAFLITDEEKAKFDVLYDKVTEQLEAFLSSSMAKVKQYNQSTGRGSGGNAPEEVPR